MNDPLTESHHDEPLVTLRRFATEAEAAMAQGLLRESGILAYTAGGQATSTFTVSGIASVPLQVPQSRVEEAEALLAKEFDTDSDVPEWTCASCSAEVDAGFAVCWQCGAEYADGANAESNYGTREETHPGKSESQAETIEERADRAFRAAVISILFFPFAFYALHLIFGCLDEPMSRTVKMKLIFAGMIAGLWTIPVTYLIFFM